jgi:hypothetical protein
LKAELRSELTVNVFPLGDNGVDGHAKAIATAVRALPIDSTAAVLGHTNTIGLIVKALTDQTIDAIGPNEFDKLFVTSIPATSPSLTLLKYRAPTP